MEIVLKNFRDENLITIKDMILQFLDKISETAFECKRCRSTFLLIPEKIGVLEVTNVYELIVDIGRIEIEKVKDERAILKECKCPKCHHSLEEIVFALDWYL